MDSSKKNGVLHILGSYLVLFIPSILQIFSGKYNKDLFLVCFIFSVLIMVDAKMKYNNIFVKINFWNIFILFIFHFVVIVL